MSSDNKVPQVRRALAGHVIRQQGAVHATTALLGGKLAVGLTDRQLRAIAMGNLTCPQAVVALHCELPTTKLVTGFIDHDRTEGAFMNPGMGDFGDRFYGTLP